LKYKSCKTLEVCFWIKCCDIWYSLVKESQGQSDLLPLLSNLVIVGILEGREEELLAYAIPFFIW